MNLIYTCRSEGFEPGGHYRNPRYFQGPEKGVASVLVEGDWPEVVEAYQALEIPVEVLQEEEPGQAAQENSAQPSWLPSIPPDLKQATPGVKAQRGKRLSAASSGKPQDKGDDLDR